MYEFSTIVNMYMPSLVEPKISRKFFLNFFVDVTIENTSVKLVPNKHALPMTVYVLQIYIIWLCWKRYEYCK